MYSKRTTERGLTLLGVLVATFILVSATLAIMGLMSRTEKIIGGSLEKFVAVNLAREGLELVQAQRDSNWLSPTPLDFPAWTNMLCVDDYPAHRIAIDYDASAGIQVVHDPTTQQIQLRRETNNGRWTHAQTGTVTTPYSREVIINCNKREITVNEAQNGEPANIIVTSRVTWQRGGKNQEVSVAGNLYDWYQKSNSVNNACEMSNPVYAAFDTDNNGVVTNTEAENAINTLQGLIGCTTGQACFNEKYDVAAPVGQLTILDYFALVNLRIQCFGTP